MYKTKYLNNILNVLKEDSPKTQQKINQILFNNYWMNIDRKVIHRNLQRLMENKIIGSIKKNKDIKSFVYYLREETWGERAQLIYFYAPFSEKLYKKLIRRYSQKGENDLLIGEIVDLYRVIEIMSLNQEIEFTNKKLIKRIKRANQRVEDLEIMDKKIKETEKEVNKFFRERKKRIKINLRGAGIIYLQGEKYLIFNNKICDFKEVEKFINQIKMNKYMHWSAYRVDKNLEDITNKIMDKMGLLFTRNYLEN